MLFFWTSFTFLFKSFHSTDDNNKGSDIGTSQIIFLSLGKIFGFGFTESIVLIQSSKFEYKNVITQGIWNKIEVEKTKIIELRILFVV